MADVKSLLKETKKLIDEKKYKEAQEHCKTILQQDNQNYLGLVFLAKSLQESEQAPLAFKKAISCKRDNPLAWLGLINYYEKYDSTETKSKLFAVYEEVLELQLEEDKLIEILNKICQIGSSTKNPLAVSIIIKFLSENSNNILKNVAGKELLNLLKSDVPYSTDKVDSIITILEKMYDDDSTNTFLEMAIFKAISSKPDKTSVVVQKITGLNIFATNRTLKEWLCKYLFIKYMERETQTIANLENWMETVTKNIEDYKYAGFLKSAFLYEQGNYLEAFKLCVPLVNYVQPQNNELLFIIQCTVVLKKWPVAEKLAKSFLDNVTDEQILNKFKKYLFISLAKQQKWKQAFSLVTKGLDIKFMTLEEHALLAECYIEMMEPVGDILQNLKHTQYYTPLEALQLIKKGDYDQTVSLLEGNVNENGLLYYFLGLAYWELKLYDKSHINLLKAAKLDSNLPYTFLYLGHFYKRCNNDFDKARKCYEKANNILPFDDRITNNLSEIYVRLGQIDLNYELLYSLQNCDLKESFWVNFRLGLHYLNNRDWDKAILRFRNVLKVNANDPITFECLAAAYFSRGSYTSALKTYKKTISLNPNKTPHCLTKIGYIHMLLAQYSEAISKFEEVLKISPESLLALKGISETWMKVAKKRYSFKMFGSARDAVQNAIDYIIKTISLEKRFISLYKILGDAFMFVTRLPVTYAYVYIQGLFHETNELRKIDKLQIFSYAIACFSRINKLNNEHSSFDLAATYLSLYREENKPIYLQSSFELAVDCVKKKSTSWINWNLLGKVLFYMKKYNFAQHCFIKAINLTGKLPIAKSWCNLGTLYLKLKLYKLANYCYWRGQSALPSYPQSWIGQGLIAERIREHEAMDLFRHASHLGYHPESALAYSDWVCRTLKSGDMDNSKVKYEIYGLHAILYSTDLMQWYCSFEKNNACAHTILGILQERLGLLESAKISYESALINIEDSKRNIALLNMGRILIRLEHYDEAIIVYKAITEATLNSVCGLALSLFKKGIYEDAYTTYDMALHWVTEQENQKYEIMVAMAGIMYAYKGPDEAKIILFQSIQLSKNKPSPYCLFASCSLGILHTDENLSKLAIKALQKYEAKAKYSSDIGFLKSYLYVCDDLMEHAIKSISDTIYSFPNNATLWFCLAQYSLRTSNTKFASACAQRALCAAHECLYPDENYPAQQNAKILATASVAEHIAGNKDQSLSIAKKALHMYPYESEVWAALIFCLVSNQAITDYKRRWLISASGHIRRHFNTSRNLSIWAGIIEKKLIK